MKTLATALSRVEIATQNLAEAADNLRTASLALTDGAQAFETELRLALKNAPLDEDDILEAALLASADAASAAEVELELLWQQSSADRG